MPDTDMRTDAGLDTGVVVVGGGPVGVATAIMCARRGLGCVVLERATEVYDLPRAIVMDDEIQRALALAGADVGSVTSPLKGAEFIDAAGTRIIGLDVPEGIDFPSGYLPVVRYYQPELEHHLRAVAAAAGVELRLGAEVVRVEQDAESVAAVCSDGTVVRGRWLVAADGAASPIRKSLGIAFVDQGFDQDWLVVDVQLTGDDPGLPELVQQICDPARPSTYVPGHDRYRRWEFQLQPGETREEMTRPERVWELLAPWLTPDHARMVRAVVYRFHATVAERMRQGRIVLAGDAAHQTPPFLGQGLCAGIRDGANLSWKLQMVATGAAGEQLLDTYDVERRPHAAGLVAHAVDMGRLIDQLAGRGGGSDDLENAYGGQRPFPHLTSGLLAGEHPFVGRQVMNPIVGGRRLDVAMGAGWAVVTADPSAIEGEVLDRWRSLGAEVVTTDALDAAAVYVVRPDRQVAAVAAGVEEFVDASRSLLTGMGLVFA